MSLRLARPLLALAALLAAASAAAAQGLPGFGAGAPSRVFLGLDALVAAPQGDFDRYIGVGGGLGGHALFKLGLAGALALRVEAGVLQYGHERKRGCLGGVGGCRVSLDLNTDNRIVLFGVGPQIMVPDGRFRPYLTGTAGLAYFFTESSLSGRDEADGFARTNNFDDATFAWTAGGGIYIPLRRRAHPISLDLGARYHGNGEARYLREGSIADNPDGSITISPIRSQTNFLIFHLGVTFGL
jgi:Outer membrane protein beta-barrel domain